MDLAALTPAALADLAKNDPRSAEFSLILACCSDRAAQTLVGYHSINFLGSEATLEIGRADAYASGWCYKICFDTETITGMVGHRYDPSGRFELVSDVLSLIHRAEHGNDALR